MIMMMWYDPMSVTWPQGGQAWSSCTHLFLSSSITQWRRDTPRCVPSPCWSPRPPPPPGKHTWPLMILIILLTKHFICPLTLTLGHRYVVSPAGNVSIVTDHVTRRVWAAQVTIINCLATCLTCQHQQERGDTEQHHDMWDKHKQYTSKIDFYCER